MKKIIKFLTVVFAVLIFTDKALAQLAPMGAQYYENEYMGNPAMAGINEGLRLNLGHLTSWNTIPGSPKYYSFTADISSGANTGLGINLYQDKAGLLNRSKVM